MPRQLLVSWSLISCTVMSRLISGLAGAAQARDSTGAAKASPVALMSVRRDGLFMGATSSVATGAAGVRRGGGDGRYHGRFTAAVNKNVFGSAPTPVMIAAGGRHVNLTEFAGRIGLSISTVSRALNGYHDVSAATRARVIKAAERLGYMPHAVARNLRLGRAEAIGFVLSPPQSSFANFFHSELLSGIDERVHDTSYHLVVTAAKSLADELIILRRMVEQRQVDALILCRTRRYDDRIRYLLSSGVPFATVGRSETEGDYPWLDIDHCAIARRATGRLAGFGHCRIALINTPAIYTYSGDAKRGWRAALAAAGLPATSDLYTEAGPTEHGGQEAARRLLCGRGPPPTGIVCAHDLMALGLLTVMAERGWRAGREISVIGSDNSPLARFTDPPLTTFAASFRKAGQRVADILLRAMAGAKPRELREVWEPELIVRESDGPVATPVVNSAPTAPESGTVSHGKPSPTMPH